MAAQPQQHSQLEQLHQQRSFLEQRMADERKMSEQEPERLECQATGISLVGVPGIGIVTPAASGGVGAAASGGSGTTVGSGGCDALDQQVDHVGARTDSAQEDDLLAQQQQQEIAGGGGGGGSGGPPQVQPQQLPQQHHQLSSHQHHLQQLQPHLSLHSSGGSGTMMEQHMMPIHQLPPLAAPMQYMSHAAAFTSDEPRRDRSRSRRRHRDDSRDRRRDRSFERRKRSRSRDEDDYRRRRDSRSRSRSRSRGAPQAGGGGGGNNSDKQQRVRQSSIGQKGSMLGSNGGPTSKPRYILQKNCVKLPHVKWVCHPDGRLKSIIWDGNHSTRQGKEEMAAVNKMRKMWCCPSAVAPPPEMRVFPTWEAVPPDEKARRLMKNQCLACGEAGHGVKGCNLLKGRRFEY